MNLAHPRVMLATLLIAASLLVGARQPLLDRSDFLPRWIGCTRYYMAPEGLQRPERALDRWPSGLSRHRRLDLRRLFHLPLRRSRPRRRVCRSGGADHAERRVEGEASWRRRRPRREDAIDCCSSIAPSSCRRSSVSMRSIARRGTAAPGRAVDQRCAGLSRHRRVDLRRLPQRPARRTADASRRGSASSRRSKRPTNGSRNIRSAGLVRFAVIGDYGIAGDPARDVSMLVKSWDVDFIITTGDNNYPNGAAATIDANIGQVLLRLHLSVHGQLRIDARRATGSSRRWAITTGKRRAPRRTSPTSRCRATSGTTSSSSRRCISSRSTAIRTSRTASRRLGAGAVAAEPARSVDAAVPVRLHASRAVFVGQNGSTRALQWPYGSWGASAVLAGHDHTYERIMRDGIPVLRERGGRLRALRVRHAGGRAAPSDTTPTSARCSSRSIAIAAVFRFITRSGVVIDTHTIAAGR